MNLLHANNVWQASGLPDGLSFSKGIISGTPKVKGNFTVPITVTNSLGTSSKDIKIITRYRPGTQKFSILQNGEEIEQVTIAQLQKMVQDGTAQEKYNCTNTQIVLPVVVPDLIYSTDMTDKSTIKTLSNYVQNVAVNFCSFRNVTLQDGTIKPGLILQFNKTLWSNVATFDQSVDSGNGFHNRWKYCQLRRWLNSSGLNWFSPAYSGESIFGGIEYEVENPTLQSKIELAEYSRQAYDDYIGCEYITALFATSYADDYVAGFLDYMPNDLVDILQPVKVQTYVSHTDDRFDEPDFIDGEDVDVTYDKIFIPSLEEMNIDISAAKYFAPPKGIERKAWEYYIDKFDSKNPVAENINKDAYNNWGECLGDDIPVFKDMMLTYEEIVKGVYTSYYGQYIEYSDGERTIGKISHVLTRSVANGNGYKFFPYCICKDSSSQRLGVVMNAMENSSFAFPHKFKNPAPAFVIC